MKKELYKGNKKIAEFEIAKGFDVKMALDKETEQIKVLPVKRKE